MEARNSGLNFLIAVNRQKPLIRGQGSRIVFLLGEPIKLARKDARTSASRDFASTIYGAGIHQDDFVGDSIERGESAR